MAEETTGSERLAPEEREPPRSSGRHPIARMLVIGTIASAIGVALVLLIDWFPPAASAGASSVDTIYDVTLIVAVPIFVLVMSVAIYSVIRFRARPGDMRDGAPIHGNARLEVVWVAIPFVIVSALAAYSIVVLDDVEARRPGALQVGVRAQQFAWNYQYPQRGGRAIESQELVLPVNRQVNFTLDAVDVIHSFWVPDFRIKQDTVPGIQTETRTVPIRTGRFDVVCTELCGAGHSTMRSTARVVTAAEFDRWLAGKRAAAGGAGAGAGGGATTGASGPGSAGGASGAGGRG